MNTGHFWLRWLPRVALLAGLAAVVSTILGVLDTWQERQRATAKLYAQKQEDIRNLAGAVSALLWDLNREALQEALRVQLNVPDILGVQVWQKQRDEEVLFASAMEPGFTMPSSLPPAGIHLLSRDIERGGRSLGTVRVAYDEEVMRRELRQQLTRILLLNGVVLAGVVFLLVLVTLQRRAAAALEAKGRELAAANLALEAEIAERKRAAVELVAARDAAERASRVKTEFLANMSHELRTPLNAVAGMARMLDEGVPMQEQHGVFLALQEAVDRLLAAVADILDYTALEAGRLPVAEEPWVVREVLQGLAGRFEGPARAKGLRLELTVAETVPVTVRGDRRLVERIVAALLDNAVKFTVEGGVRVEVSSLPAEGGAVQLRCAVQDTGPGIPDADAARIFQPFEQVEGSFTRRHEGLGLGLALASGFAGLCGGRLRLVRTSPGAAFVFEWTACVVDPSPVKPPAAPCADPLALSILVVDDNLVNRKVLVRMLEKAGYHPDSVKDGAEAVAAVRAGAYDVVLMDVQMPVMDGYEATRTIRRELPPEHQPCIVAVTAHALPTDREECLASGMDDYFTKPVQPDKITAFLRELAAKPAAERRRIS